MNRVPSQVINVDGRFCENAAVNAAENAAEKESAENNLVLFAAKEQRRKGKLPSSDTAERRQELEPQDNV